MQPDQASKSLRRVSGISPRTTMSEMAMRPPGLRTRKVSPSTLSLSGERLTTQLLIITSTEASGRGTSSISPLRKRALATPAFSWLARATSSISSVMSKP